MKFKIVVLLVAVFASLAMSRTVVSVNGVNVDERELYGVIQKITRGQYASLPDDKKQMAQKIAVEQAIASVLLKQEAAKSDIKKSKAYKKAFVDYVKNVVEPELMYQSWVERELKKIKVSDKEIKKYYKDNKDRFNQPKLSHVHHILLKTEKEANDLIALISKAKNRKAAFMKLASEKMGTADTGASDLGKLHDKSNMAPPFKAAYLKMKANSLSKKAVKTSFGYHVIYVDTVEGGKTRTFKELKPAIKKNIQGEKLEKLLKAKVKKLREKASINFK